MKSPPHVHFHIHWSSGAFEWERWDSRDEAEQRAKELAGPSEKYSIEQFDDSCEHCKKLVSDHRT